MFGSSFAAICRSALPQRTAAKCALSYALLQLMVYRGGTAKQCSEMTALLGLSSAEASICGADSKGLQPMPRSV